MWAPLLTIIATARNEAGSNPKMPPLERLDCHASSGGSQLCVSPTLFNIFFLGYIGDA
jgi:hypothetical protein